MEENSVNLTEDGVVILDYEDLLNGKDYSKSIEVAFGYEGIGLLLVKGVPKYNEYRSELLPLAWKFTSLPDEIKEKVVHKTSNYSVGWSHGKEILKEGKFDTFKGSYYNNPQFDEPTSDEELIKKYPESCLPNIWPDDDFPELKPAFMQLGQLVVEVGSLVAKQCDKYAKKILGSKYEDGQLEKIIKTSRTCKARLLYYFPIKDDKTPRTRDSWCGWHNDHSSLTGLCSAMFINETEKKVDVASPDQEAGLYARTRTGNEFKVKIPKDCLAFQIGESSQVLTGGALRATPHAVQACAWPASKDYGRSSFAIFMQPDNDFLMKLPEGTDIKKVAVPQYKQGMTFADFHKATITSYYSE